MSNDTLRAIFESWTTGDGKWPKAVERSGDGTYRLMQTVSDWKAWQACASAIAAQAPRADANPAKPMTAARAAFFMDRFRRNEKLLGPNERAAFGFVISMLKSQAASVGDAQPAYLLRDLAAELGIDAMRLAAEIEAAGFERYSVNMAVPANVCAVMRQRLRAKPLTDDHILQFLLPWHAHGDARDRADLINAVRAMLAPEAIAGTPSK